MAMIEWLKFPSGSYSCLKRHMHMCTCTSHFTPRHHRQHLKVKNNCWKHVDQLVLHTSVSTRSSVHIRHSFFNNPPLQTDAKRETRHPCVYGRRQLLSLCEAEELQHERQSHLQHTTNDEQRQQLWFRLWHLIDSWQEISSKEDERYCETDTHANPVDRLVWCNSDYLQDA
jgi:hypothetical protein